MPNLLRIEVADGKYTVIQNEDGSLTALRYNQPWRTCSGDNLIFFLASELQEAHEKIDKLELLLKQNTQP